MKLLNDDCKVLIVGGGPVGMLTALELAQFGVRSRIISKHQRTSPHSKATIIWPRVLELLSRTGVSKEIISRGHYFDQMKYYSNKKEIGNLDFDKLQYTNYKYGIAIPQWKTEEILESLLNQADIYVEYGCEFVHGKNTGQHVEVSLLNSQDDQEYLNYDWVIGADGRSSKVRDCFNFGFDGFQMKTRLAITDTELISETTSREVGYYLHRTGNMVLAPIGDGLFRVGASVPANYQGEIDREFFNNALAERVPGNRSLGNMNFCGTFDAHVRSASTYKIGNVMLVGDAAHAMSPSGAQGMNSGFQDATNLAWKLAGVIHGNFKPSLLESYSSERKNSIDRISSLSTFLADVSLYKNRAAIFARDISFRIASKSRVIDKYLTPRIAQLDIPLGGLQEGKVKLELGRRIPLEWDPSSLAPYLSLTKHTIFFWPGEKYVYSVWDSVCEKAKKSILHSDVVDLSGKVLGYLKGLLPKHPVCLVVRPDGFISEVININMFSPEESIQLINKKVA
jgi:2-polyprenyl-6-methoxyphenol hydroxylase-like FAD-dependent oxidoreductase